LLQLPFVMLVVFYSVPFVAVAFASNEVSVSAGGLPYRWLIKGALLAGFGLLALASFSRLLRVCAALFGAPKPLPTSEDR